MTDPQSASAAPARKRFDLIDIARGLALIGVMVFHLSWDLRYYEFVLWPIDVDFGWIAFQKTLVSAFVGLSGFSLVLAHGHSIRWRSFWRRWLFLFGAALLATISTWFTFQPAFVYFGVLHALALFALMGLLFLRVPSPVLLIAGAAIVAAGIGFQDPVFNEKPLSWLGFWVVPPYTNDLVPVFPWFGVFLIGMGLSQWLTRPAPAALLSAPLNWGWPGRALKWIGRHSLILYLVHQPLLLAVMVPLESVMQPQNWHRAERFMGECQQSCNLSAGQNQYCAGYCACSLEQIEAHDLWDAVSRIDPTPEQSADIASMVNLCIAMGKSGEK